MNNQTIAITGGSKGIGKAIALHFAKNGFRVAVCARNSDSLEQLQREISEVSPAANHIFFQADVTDRKQLLEFAATILQQWKKASVIVNNAGVFLPGQVISEEDGVLEKLIQTNLYSAYHFTRAMLPPLIEAKTGAVFNICSIASLQAYHNGGSYSISKFGLLGFSKALREELKPHNIKVTSMMPGATLTDSWKGTELDANRFISAADIGKLVFDLYQLSPSAVVEDITIRPLPGDI
ncbi:MAG: SDR family oxidoreductase [Chitinophagales bacterium]